MSPPVAQPKPAPRGSNSNSDSSACGQDDGLEVLFGVAVHHVWHVLASVEEVIQLASGVLGDALGVDIPLASSEQSDFRRPRGALVVRADLDDTLRGCSLVTLLRALVAEFCVSPPSPTVCMAVLRPLVSVLQALDVYNGQLGAAVRHLS
jgi:hypothetical protein